MHDIVVVAVVQGLQDLIHYVAGIRLGKGLGLVYHVNQIEAVNKLVHYVDAFIVNVRIEYFHDVRMIQFLQYLHLISDPLKILLSHFIPFIELKTPFGHRADVIAGMDSPLAALLGKHPLLPYHIVIFYAAGVARKGIMPHVLVVDFQLIFG